MINRIKTMKKSLLVLFSVTYLLHTAFCQKWKSKQNRKVYAIDNKPLNLTWEIDAPGINLSFATFQRADETGQPKFTFVALNSKGGAKVYGNDIVSYQSFGKLFIHKLNKAIDKKVLVSIQFVGVATPLTDIVTIEYVDYTPNITKGLLGNTLQVVEQTDSSRHHAFTVIAKGNPNVTVLWELNNINVESIDGFHIQNKISKVLQEHIIESTLTVDELKAKDNGVLTARAKYFPAEQEGPESISKMTIDVQYPPRNIKLTSNITSKVIFNQAHVGLTCTVDANPVPVYTLREAAKVVYSGKNSSASVFIDNFHHSRQARFVCQANNSVGTIESDYLVIQIINGTIPGKLSDEDDSDWWIYYVVGVGVAVVVFFGMGFTLLMMRSRMRSMNIKAEVSRVKMRSIKSQEDYERKAMRHHGPNHAYSLNQRGAPDGHTPSGIANRAYDSNNERID